MAAEEQQFLQAAVAAAEIVFVARFSLLLHSRHGPPVHDADQHCAHSVSRNHGLAGASTEWGVQLPLADTDGRRTALAVVGRAAIPATAVAAWVVERMVMV